MPTLCVILAAGDATRMPNKLMLATPSGMPVIESSISLAERSGFKPIIITKPKSVIEVYARHRATYVYQEKADGVVNALKLIDDDDMYVLAGDNIYPDRKLLSSPNSFAQVRRIKSEHLDGWIPRRWVPRHHISEFKYAGYCFLKGGVKWGVDLIETFNLNNVRASSCASDRWYDVGTEESYKELWNEDLA